MGAIAGPIVAIFLLPLVTAEYTEADFGKFSALIAAATIIANVMTGKLELAFPMAKSICRKELILHSAILLSVVSACLMMLTTLVFDIFLDFDFWYVFLLILASLSLALVFLFQQFFLSLQNIRRVSIAKSLTAGEPVLQLLLANLSLSYKLGWAFLGAQLIILSCLLRVNLSKLISRIRDFSPIRRVLLRYVKFMTFSIPAYLINSSATHAIPIIFMYYLSPTLVGEMLIFQRTIGGIVFMLSGVLAKVFVAEISQDASQSREEIRKGYYQLLALNVILGFVFFATILLFGTSVNALFSEGWQLDSALILPLALLYCIQLAVVPLSQTLNYLQRQEWQFTWDVARMLVVLGGVIYCIVANYESYVVLQVYVGLMTIMYMILIAVHGIALKNDESGT